MDEEDETFEPLRDPVNSILERLADQIRDREQEDTGDE